VPFCFIGILPRFPARRFRLRAENAAPLTTPGLRSVAPVRSAFVAKPPHVAFPSLGRCAPANAASALTAARLAFHAAFAGWHPATGLRHAATSMSPLAQGSFQAGGIVPKIATTSCRRFALPSSQPKLRMVGIQPRRVTGILPANEKGHRAVAS